MGSFRRVFLFPEDRVWVLQDGQGYGIGNLDGGAVGLLIFSDEDLATTFAAEAGLDGKMATAIPAGQPLLELLSAAHRLGVTHLALDSQLGRRVPVLTIETALEEVQRQIE